MNRLAEIETRKGEIRELLKGTEEVDLDVLEQELRELDAEKTKIEKRAKIAASINEGELEARTVDKQEQPKAEKRDLSGMKWPEAIAQPEYRSAWAKDMLGRHLTKEERELYDRTNIEYREFTHTTENSQVLIPKTVVAGIWKRAEEQYPLWADVRKLRVNGNLSLLKGSASADAEWYEEEDIVDTDQLAFGTLELTGCELAKAVTVTWKLKKMAIEDFIAYIEREIGDRMGAALSKGVYAGRGKPGVGETFKPEPRGIKTALAAEADTPQIVEYEDALAYANLTEAMGGIHASYGSGVTIYANSATVWGTLANMLDGQGRPLFIPDVTAGGVGRIFGRIIKPDASIPNGELLFGNTERGYVANINEDITMYQEDHVRKRLTDYMGYAIVDGDVQDNKAFVILQPAVGEG